MPRASTRTRIEHDSLGPMPVPADALYGAQTARAIRNFPISGWTMPRAFLAALGLIKQCAAQANRRAGRLDAKRARAIAAAAAEVAAGGLDAHFPLDVFQTGSGTSTNMNANEVIARRAMAIMGAKARRTAVHPNDHVNMSQSSNDVIPAAIHVAAVVEIHRRLLPAMEGLRKALALKARQFNPIVKIARTHLMDAVPIRLGQEFSGYAAQIAQGAESLKQAAAPLLELPLGGTAVGTGLNAPPGFAREVCRGLAKATALRFVEARNHFAAQGAKDACVLASGSLRACAIAMGKIASDIRLLGSGPRCGLGELELPATQPGSSIMPGKVNPVMCESVIQVACQVVGCDAAIAAGATGGVGGLLELNVAMPLIAANLLTEIRLLTSSTTAFADRCVRGLKANRRRCEELTEQSLAMITALAPRIGYDAAAAIAAQAARQGRTIREVCRAQRLLSSRDLDSLLDVRAQTGR